MSEIKLIHGSCADQTADAVVNAANSGLIEGGGICGVIFAKCGSTELAQEWLNKNDIYAMLKDKIDTALKQSEALRARNRNTDSSKEGSTNRLFGIIR